MSLARAAELPQTVYALVYTLPGTSEEKRQLLQMDRDQSLLYQAIHS